MNVAVLKDWQAKIKAGDNQPLSDMMEQYGQYCVQKLMQTMNCPEEEAKDIFVEILLELRDKILNGRQVEVQHLPAYLFGACRNRWLKVIAQKQKQRQKAEDVFRYYYIDRFGYAAYDELVREEEKALEFSQKQKRIEQILQTLKTLTEKCQTILRLFYVEEKSMQEIAQQMNFSGADTAKTTKSRCFKKWRNLLNND